MLNAKEFEDLTKENVLKNRNVIELFAYYIPSFKRLGEPFKSELRKDDNPSCCVYSNGLYLDFGNGEKHDIFSYIQKKYMCNFYEALKIINSDFNLGLSKSITPLPIFLGQTEKKETQIKYKTKEFTELDLLYWRQFGITKDILKKFNVFSLEYYWVNDHLFNLKKNELCFLYVELVKGNKKYKVYKPNEIKGKKFPASNDGGAIYGIHQLPESGESCFITSSKKDVMTLYSIGENAVAPTSESAFIKPEVISFLKERFKKVYVFYDYDDKGIDRAESLNNYYDLDGCIYTSIKESKDPSDFRKDYGENKLKELIKSCMKLQEKI